jgi:hypothetical protein
MRTLTMITLGTAVLVGCTVKETVVEPASPAVVYQPAPTVVYQSPPTVVTAPATITYSVANQVQYNQAAMLAGEWCRTRLSAGARAYDTKQATSPGLATFTCVTG